MVKRKVYTSKQIEAIINMKREFPSFSYRALAKETGASKSSIDRWMKNPEKIIQKTEFKEVKKKVGKIDKAKLKKLEQKLLNPVNEAQGKLRVFYDEAHLTFGVVS